MKKLKFKKLWLLSTKERKARKIDLDDNVTAVVADNEYGKSSLVKSLYATLGADPQKTPESWTAANVSSLLNFSIDQDEFYMLRFGPVFALFNDRKEPLWAVNGITKGLAPKLSKMVDFQVELTTKQGGVASPIPALCFMPFYIDQDRGWTESWESFSGTGFIKGYKDIVANFHTGMRPKEYYQAKSQKDEAAAKLTGLRKERDALNRARERVSAKRSSVGIAFEPEVFADRIQDLLKEQNALQSSYDEIKTKVAELQSSRSIALEEMQIAKRILSELEEDIKFLKKEDESEIICPTCNTVHLNDFSNRYGLMNDADACREIYVTSVANAEKLSSDIKNAMVPTIRLNERIAKITSILETVRGEMKLRDMLKDESERMVDAVFLDESKELDEEVGKADQSIASANAEMKKYDDRKHKKEITDYYVKKMVEFCKELDIVNVPSSVYKKIRPTISEAGSSQPRLFLAYNYAILHTIAKFSTGCFAPIVIDTPKQQDPDSARAKSAIEFCIKHKPKGAQLIIASGSMHAVEFAGRTIEPQKKHSVLEETQFSSVHEFMDPFIKSAMD
ncbi:hypothetical protein [Shimia marina]|uniref:Chromosome segregation protein n=1 Tax=Shimia marina TaxID=321267 RepID=A0A0N7LRG6_9RHOB|nr:hypothetical protein [Shimia marina]CUH50764.1 hypothetical protein SHM7688_00193 [Shimia marina]SFE65465.1 hypothetical protein SAMN04488037_1142 [Shimia marina]